MVIMKRIYFVSLSLILTLTVSAQSGKEVNLNKENNEIQSRFINRKEKGFYNIMQASLLLGTNQFTDNPDYPFNRTNLIIAPSFTTTYGFIFNKHWAASAGVGFEIFNYN